MWRRSWLNNKSGKSQGIWCWLESSHPDYVVCRNLPLFCQEQVRLSCPSDRLRPLAPDSTQTPAASAAPVSTSRFQQYRQQLRTSNWKILAEKSSVSDQQTWILASNDVSQQVTSQSRNLPVGCHAIRLRLSSLISEARGDPKLPPLGNVRPLSRWDHLGQELMRWEVPMQLYLEPTDQPTVQRAISLVET